VEDDTTTNKRRDDERRGAVYRVARRLLESDARTVACVPPAPNAHVPACSREIALAMAELSGEEVVLVDAGLFGHRRYPRSERLPGNVRVLRPAITAKAEDFIEIFRALAEEGIRALIDLTGYHERGALAWALSAVEGVLIIVFSGRATDSEVLAVAQQIPVELWTGVVVFSTPPSPIPEVPAPSGMHQPVDNP
jgi:hypothetical protein